MKRSLPLLILIAIPTAALGQSLEGLKEQYQPVSPLHYQQIKEARVIDPKTTNLTPEEEAIAAQKAQELAQKQAQEQKVFLDTDFKFFESLAVPVTEKEDDLDKAVSKNPLEQDLQFAKMNDTAVKSEIKTTTPPPVSRAEGLAADQRRELLMKRVTENSRTIKACIVGNIKKGVSFKGTEMTLVWDVTETGSVEAAKIDSTDVTNKAIQDCVVNSISAWNFADAVKPSPKKSRIQYTFRFNREAKPQLASQDTPN